MLNFPCLEAVEGEEGEERPQLEVVVAAEEEEGLPLKEVAEGEGEGEEEEDPR